MLIYLVAATRPDPEWDWGALVSVNEANTDTKHFCLDKIYRYQDWKMLVSIDETDTETDDMIHSLKLWEKVHVAAQNLW